MMDIEGPEIRTASLEVPIELKPGEIFDFTVKPGEHAGGAEIRSVDVNYRDLVNDINVGDTVLVDSGLIRLEVLSKDHAHIRCRVLRPGSPRPSRRHINLPGVKVNLPSFTQKDRADTLVGIAEGVDFIALSFVREAHDIDLLRLFLEEHKSRARIVAKIEDQSAIDNLDDIIRATDVLMIARGDLGIEVPLRELPVIQRRAVRTCLAIGRPVIIATHMLESMIGQPRCRAGPRSPDVANAVYRAGRLRHALRRDHRRQIPARVHADPRLHRAPHRGGAGTGLPRAGRFHPGTHEGLPRAVVLANEFPRSLILVFTRHGTNAAGLSATARRARRSWPSPIPSRPCATSRWCAPSSPSF